MWCDLGVFSSAFALKSNLFSLQFFEAAETVP